MNLFKIQIKNPLQKERVFIASVSYDLAAVRLEIDVSQEVEATLGCNCRTCSCVKLRRCPGVGIPASLRPVQVADLPLRAAGLYIDASI